jgi:hypothetical protein
MKKQKRSKGHMWAVMKAQSWGQLTVNGIPLQPPQDGPCAFIPLFKTRRQAIVSEHGRADYVREVEPLPPDEACKI